LCLGSYVRSPSFARDFESRERPRGRPALWPRDDARWRPRGALARTYSSHQHSEALSPHGAATASPKAVPRPTRQGIGDMHRARACGTRAHVHHSIRHVTSTMGNWESYARGSFGARKWRQYKVRSSARPHAAMRAALYRICRRASPLGSLHFPAPHLGFPSPSPLLS